MNLNLDGRRAIVLASSRGLGRASATALANEGARVVISSRNRDRLESAAAAIVEETGVDDSTIVPVVCDLSTPESVPDTMRSAIDALGGLDIVVTNTGGPPKIDFETATVADFRRAYRYVIEGIVASLDATLPALVEDGGGAVTHIVAAAAQEPETHHVVANTLRLGVYGLSKSIAREYAGAGVRSNCLCPRKVGPAPGGPDAVSPHIEAYAEAHDCSYEAAAEAYIAEIVPLGRRGELDEFGRMVALFSSDVTGFVTGQVLNVDGGELHY